MKHGSTLLLKLIILFFGIIVLALCIFVLPKGIISDNTGTYRPILLGMYLPAVPFFIGIFQAFKLLNYIDQNKAFSGLSVRALRIIKYCASAVGIMYAVGMPFIFRVAEGDDAPGVILAGLTFTFAPLVIAVIAAVLEKVPQNAIDIKLENDQII